MAGSRAVSKVGAMGQKTVDLTVGLTVDLTEGMSVTTMAVKKVTSSAEMKDSLMANY